LPCTSAISLLTSARTVCILTNLTSTYALQVASFWTH
jgi:hypothetical protein